jgi:NAD dependent epimerase/dehydratase family enzyme
MARPGLGGPVAGGAQYVPWIHGHDLVRAVGFLADRDDLAGPVNPAAPHVAVRPRVSVLAVHVAPAGHRLAGIKVPDGGATGAGPLADRTVVGGGVAGAGTG